MVNHKKNLFQVILYLTLLTSSYLSAQEISPLFTSISKESSFVNADQAKIYDEYALDEKVLYTQFVRIDDLRNFLVDNSITFNFPPVNAILTAKTNYTEKFDSENYVWNGIFPNDEGDITIISEGKLRYGNLTYKDHFYSFEDTGNGLSLIKEIETPEGEVIASNGKTDEPTDISELAKVTCSPTEIYNVDVLFLFTEKVENLSKATKIANSTITEMNLICKNSSANATFTSVGIEPMPIPNFDNPDGPNFFFAPTLPARTDGAAADLTIKNLRESKGADIVFILYNGPTQLRLPNGTIIGNIFGAETLLPLSKSGPYFLIHKDFATNSKYQIAMVLGGRSLGAGTEILAGRYPDSRPHKYGSKFSVMHHAGPKNKSKFISNPKVLDGGVATGIVDKEDNVKAINTTVCTVSSYFDSEKPAKSEIFFDKPCIGKPFEIWIEHSGFKTNTNTVYQFSYSTDGIKYSTPVSQNSIFYTVPILSNTNLVPRPLNG